MGLGGARGRAGWSMTSSKECFVREEVLEEVEGARVFSGREVDGEGEGSCLAGSGLVEWSRGVVAEVWCFDTTTVSPLELDLRVGGDADSSTSAGENRAPPGFGLVADTLNDAVNRSSVTSASLSPDVHRICNRDLRLAGTSISTPSNTLPLRAMASRLFVRLSAVATLSTVEAGNLPRAFSLKPARSRSVPPFVQRRCVANTPSTGLFGPSVPSASCDDVGDEKGRNAEGVVSGMACWRFEEKDEVGTRTTSSSKPALLLDDELDVVRVSCSMARVPVSGFGGDEGFVWVMSGRR